MDLSRYSAKGFDRGAGRVKEALWITVKSLFFLPPWPWPSEFRVALLRAFGARVGRGTVIRSGVNISFPWRLRMGDWVWIGEDVRILSLAQVTLGSHVCLSQGSFLCAGSHDWRSATFDLLVKPIEAGNRVWIAAEAFVGPGVKIGEGSVLAARAVVVRDVAPYVIVAGNPARVIGQRHEEKPEKM